MMVTQSSQFSVSTPPSFPPPATDGPNAPSVASASPGVVVSVSPDGRMAALNDANLLDAVDAAGDTSQGSIACTQPAQEPPVQLAGNLQAAIRQLGDQGIRALGHVNTLGYKVADRVNELTEEVQTSEEFASLREQASELTMHAKALQQEAVEQVEELKQSQEFQELRENVKEVKDKVHNIIKKFRW